MSSKVKKLIIAAGILVVLGMVLLVAGAVSGGLSGGFSGDYVEMSESYDDVKRLDINADIYDVKLTEGKEFKIDYTYFEKYGAPSVSLDNGTLNFASQSKNNWFNFDLPFLNWGENDTQTLIITYPAGTKFEEGSLNLDLGDCVVNNAEFDDLEIDLNMGSLDLKNIKVNFLTANLDMGSIDAKNLESKGIEADLNMGNFNLFGKLEGVTAADCDMGSIDIRTSLPQEKYSYSAEVDLGDVSVKGGGSFSNALENKDAPHEIRVKANMGNVDLKFSN